MTTSEEHPCSIVVVKVNTKQQNNMRQAESGSLLGAWFQMASSATAPEAISSSKMSHFLQMIRHHTPEDCALHSQLLWEP
jgi:molybdopterin biosynthesis enzyme MoaB